MKKLIIKTIAFSLGILAVGVCLFYLIMATCAPSSLGNFYFRTGNEKLAVKYAEKAYHKSEDISDLATLVERSAVCDNSELVKKYGFTLINHSDYEELSTNKGSSYKYYVAGSLVEALYKLGETQTAIDTAFDNTLGYSQVNPIRVLISLAMQGEDSKTLSTILSRLENRESKNELCNNDISLIREHLN
ncbi:MAG: hypothetical protein IJA97_00565 [Clostridia bacterium]|nr:hypothetical protein [Clostridia bacterium]